MLSIFIFTGLVDEGSPSGFGVALGLGLWSFAAVGHGAYLGQPLPRHWVALGAWWRRPPSGLLKLASWSAEALWCGRSPLVPCLNAVGSLVLGAPLRHLPAVVGWGFSCVRSLVQAKASPVRILGPCATTGANFAPEGDLHSGGACCGSNGLHVVAVGGVHECARVGGVERDEKVREMCEVFVLAAGGVVTECGG